MRFKILGDLAIFDGEIWVRPAAEVVNQPPTANAATFSVIVGNSTTLDLSNYFSDSDGTASLHEIIPVSSNFTYTTSGDNITVTSTGVVGDNIIFDYTVVDDDGATATARVTGDVIEEGGVSVGELSNMYLVATGEQSAELRFSSTVAGTAYISTTYWSDPIGESQILNTFKGKFPYPMDHQVRGSAYFTSPSYIFVTAPVVEGENVIEVSNNVTQSRISGLAAGMRIAAHFFIKRQSDGTNTQVFNSNEVVLLKPDLEVDFTSGQAQITTPDETGSIVHSITGGPFAGDYTITLPVTTAYILGAHAPVLSGATTIGSELSVAPPPTVWNTTGFKMDTGEWSIVDRPVGKVRWLKDNVLVEETESLTRTADSAGSWTVEYKETKGGTTLLSSASNAIIVS